jgi:LysR family transcriptional regulator, glycine cleavage system transcriptional activator
MAKNLPPLNALRAFEAASRLGGFVRAAQELHVTAAAVSHQIKQLEHWLGVQLFERSARGVALNTSGLEYAARIRDAFDRLMITSAAARAQRSRRMVTIRAHQSLSVMWLLPCVLELQQVNPDLEIKIVVDAMESLPSRSGADLSIFYQRPDVDGYQQQLLMSCNFSLFAAPSILPRSGSLSALEIMSRPLIHNAFEDRAWRHPTMEDWFRASGVQVPPILSGLRLNLIHMSAAACERGAGFALLIEQFCAEQIRKRTLVKVSDVSVPSPHPYYILSKKRVSEDVRAVRDWLIQRAQMA